MVGAVAFAAAMVELSAIRWRRVAPYLKGFLLLSLCSLIDRDMKDDLIETLIADFLSRYYLGRGQCGVFESLLEQAHYTFPKRLHVGA